LLVLTRMRITTAADFYMGAFTFTLGGFWTSDDFAYPKGRSHYWAEIAGAGTLEVNVNGYDWLTGGVENRGDYVLGESPRNIWTIHAPRLRSTTTTSAPMMMFSPMKPQVNTTTA